MGRVLYLSQSALARGKGPRERDESSRGYGRLSRGEPYRTKPGGPSRGLRLAVEGSGIGVN